MKATPRRWLWRWLRRWLWIALALAILVVVADVPALLVSQSFVSHPSLPVDSTQLDATSLKATPSAMPSATFPAIVGQQFIYTPPTATPIPPIAHFATVAYFGDSLTGGYFATTQARDYASQVTAATGAREVAFMGTYGHSAANAYATMQGTPPPPAQLDIVELGTNDTEDTSTFSRDYQGILTILRTVNPHARILCLGPWQDAEPLRIADNNAARADCAAAGGTFINLMPLFATASNRGPVGRATWHGPADGFHPNDAGHAAIARAVLAMLRG